MEALLTAPDQTGEGRPPVHDAEVQAETESNPELLDRNDPDAVRDEHSEEPDDTDDDPGDGTSS